MSTTIGRQTCCICFLCSHGIENFLRASHHLAIQEYVNQLNAIKLVQTRPASFLLKHLHQNHQCLPIKFNQSKTTRIVQGIYPAKKTVLITLTSDHCKLWGEATKTNRANGTVDKNSGQAGTECIEGILIANYAILVEDQISKVWQK